MAKSEDIQNIYEQVQQEDSDWFNSLSKLLGEDIDADLEIKELDSDTIGDQIDDETAQSQDATTDSIETIAQPALTANEAQDIGSSDGSKMQSTKESSQESVIQQSKRAPTDELNISKRENNTNKFITSRQEASTNPSQLLVQLRNKYTDERETIAPLSYFTKRGYSQEEVLSLRPQVLELIVEDNIPKPRRGVPARWVRDLEEELDEDDVEWTIEIVDGEDERVEDKATKAEISSSAQTALEVEQTTEEKSQSAKNNVSESWGPFSSSRAVVDREEERQSTVDSDGDVATSKQKADVTNQKAGVGTQSHNDYDESERRQRREMQVDEDTTPRRNRRSSPRQYDDNADERPRTRRSQRQSAEQRRPRPRRRELVIDRGDDDSDDPPPNKFWMDLPTFRDFLRTEARLRLKILGPEWKDSVLDESRWRFDLYKRWLYLLNDGVGENPLYTYGDRPRQSRRPRGTRRDSDFGNGRMRSERDRARGSYSADNDIRETGRRNRRHKLDNDPEEPRQPSARRAVVDEDISTKSLGNLKAGNGEDKLSSKNQDDEMQHASSADEDIHRSVKIDFRDRGDEQMRREQQESRRRQRGEPNSNNPRRRNRPDISPSQRKRADWKDFGDLEDQLLNGSRDDTYRDARSSSRRRRDRITDPFDDEY